MRQGTQPLPYAGDTPYVNMTRKPGYVQHSPWLTLRLIVSYLADTLKKAKKILSKGGIAAMRSRSLEFKLFVSIGLVLAIGFGTVTYLNVRRHRKDMFTEARNRAEVTASSLVASIKTIMLTGDVSKVRELVQHIRGLPTISALKIYNKNGREAFQPASTRTADEGVKEALEKVQMVVKPQPEENAVSAIVPLLNDATCQRCHGAGSNLRGAFAVGLTALKGKGNKSLAQAARLVGGVMATAVESLMVTGHAEDISSVVEEGMSAPIARVELYGAVGEQIFGFSRHGETEPLTRAELELLDDVGVVARPYERDDEACVDLLRPIMSRAECVRCHGVGEGRLGAVRVALCRKSGDAGVDELSMVADSFRGMLVAMFSAGGAAPVRYFQERVGALQGVVNFKIYGRGGERAFSDEIEAGPIIRAVLEKGIIKERRERKGKRTKFTLYTPVWNDKSCRACHGGEPGVRAVVAVSVSTGAIERKIERSTTYSILAGVTTVLLVGILLVGFCEFCVVRRIKRLGEVAERVGAGDLDLRVEDDGDDELARLARRINSMIDGLIDKERIEQSLRIAREIHLSRLPKRVPVVEGLDIAATAVPCEETGGDYYDFVWVGDKLGVIVADVASHGIGPALIMSETRAFIKATMLTAREIPTALKVVNSLLYGDLKQGRFVTLFIAEIDVEAGILRYASAGHHPGMIYRAKDGRFDILDSTAVPLGVKRDADFPMAPPMQLNEGDIIVLLTDGIVETPNARRERFGRERLQDVLAENRHRSAREMVEAVINAVAHFRGSAEQPDDLAIVVIKLMSLRTPAAVANRSGDSIRLPDRQSHRSS